LSDWRKKEIYRDVCFFHGAIHLLSVCSSAIVTCSVLFSHAVVGVNDNALMFLALEFVCNCVWS